MKCYEDEWPVLIITPSSLRDQWATSIVQVGSITSADSKLVVDIGDNVGSSVDSW